MTDVIEMLAAASPDVDSEPVPPVSDVWRKLDDAAAARSDARRSPRASDWWWRRRRVMRCATLGVAALAAGVAVLVVGTTGGGPASALAGWTPDPIRPLAGQQLLARVSVCASNPSLASLTPTLTDTRGPYSVLLYAQASTTTMCITGPGLTATGAPLIVKAGRAHTSIAPRAIATQGALRLSAPTVEFSILAGRVGRDVTAVTLTLDRLGVTGEDINNVKATTENGWFAAWWPSLQGVRSADLTTTTGSTTQTIHLPTTVCKPLSDQSFLQRCKVG